jgi:hypothetical protein
MPMYATKLEEALKAHHRPRYQVTNALLKQAAPYALAGGLANSLERRKP